MSDDDDVQTGPVEVATYRSGGESPDTVAEELESAWRTIRSDPDSLAEAAQLSGIPAQELEALSDPPFSVRAKQQGFAGVDDAVMIVAGAILVDLAKDIAKDAARDGLRKLWSFIRRRMSLGVLGRESGKPDAGDDDGSSIPPHA